MDWPITSPRLLVTFVLLAFVAGCGDTSEPSVEIHAWGNIDAFGREGETALAARYSPTLDDEACDVLDERTECVLVRCDSDEAAPLEDAGEVTVDDAALDIAVDNSYSLVVPEELVPGELLAMRATGSSAVPAHSGEVEVPERAVLTEPAAADALVLDPSEDFVVAWEPVIADRVVLSVTFGEREISCTAAGSVGHITIGSRLIDALPSDTAGTFRIVDENLVESSESGWRIWFGAHQVVLEGTAELTASP